MTRPAVLLATAGSVRLRWFAALMEQADATDRLVVLDDVPLPSCAAPLINFSGWPGRSADAALDALLAWLRATLAPEEVPDEAEPYAPEDDDPRPGKRQRRSRTDRWVALFVLSLVVFGVVALAWLDGGDRDEGVATTPDTAPEVTPLKKDFPGPAASNAPAPPTRVAAPASRAGAAGALPAGAPVRSPIDTVFAPAPGVPDPDASIPGRGLPAYGGTVSLDDDPGAAEGPADPGLCVTRAGANRLVWTAALPTAARLRLPLRDCAVSFQRSPQFHAARPAR